jgi:hypothetical protein
MPDTSWASVCQFRSAEQTSGEQVVRESSNDQDHADGMLGIAVLMHLGLRW